LHAPPEFDRWRSVWNHIETIIYSSLEALGTGGWNGRKVHRLAVSGGGEPSGHLVPDPIGFPGHDQRNDAAAETATGHPSAKRSGGAGRLNGEIHLRHRDLKVVAHRLM
jgi:hypothetical protein